MVELSAYNVVSHNVENRCSRSRFLVPDQLVVCSYLRTVQDSVYYATRRIPEYEFFSPSS